MSSDFKIGKGLKFKMLKLKKFQILSADIKINFNLKRPILQKKNFNFNAQNLRFQFRKILNLKPINFQILRKIRLKFAKITYSKRSNLK